MNAICRLNTKIASRDLEVKDLVKDLSDGVSSYQQGGLRGTLLTASF